MNRSVFFLFLNVLIIAICGLVYELLAATVASYLLGDSVFQFSTVIGVYLFAMGVGSWLSRYVGDRVAWVFIEVELAVALLGGLASAILFLSNTYSDMFPIVLYGLVFLIGMLVGLEIPLLMQILKNRLEFKDLVSRVLAFDYIGALLASLAFPLFLMPKVGVMRTPMVIGILNALVGLWATWLLRPQIKGNVFFLRVRAVLVIIGLGVAMFFARELEVISEEGLFNDRVVYSRTTPYQRIVVTRNTGGVMRLFLNGHLQFNSLDEYRYHEALVHPAMMAAASRKRVLVMGGGDGLALREIFHHPDVEKATIVDLDPGMTTLSNRFPPLAQLNEYAYHNPKLEIINNDAFIWVKKYQPDDTKYDVVIIDFPDPHNYALGKLYSRLFFRLLKRVLAPGATVAIQCTSPFMAPRTYWCIIKTMEAAGFTVKPYHVAVPSFYGIWGYALAKLDKDFLTPDRAPTGLKNAAGQEVKLKFLNDAAMKAMFALPVDLHLPPGATVEVNRLDNQVVVQYHEAEWKRYTR
jgi:spermidine synthase